MHSTKKNSALFQKGGVSQCGAFSPLQKVKAKPAACRLKDFKWLQQAVHETEGLQNGCRPLNI